METPRNPSTSNPNSHAPLVQSNPNRVQTSDQSRPSINTARVGAERANMENPYFREAEEDRDDGSEEEKEPDEAPSSRHTTPPSPPETPLEERSEEEKEEDDEEDEHPPSQAQTRPTSSTSSSKGPGSIQNPSRKRYENAFSKALRELPARKGLMRLPSEDTERPWRVARDRARDKAANKILQQTAHLAEYSMLINSTCANLGIVHSIMETPFYFAALSPNAEIEWRLLEPVEHIWLTIEERAYLLYYRKNAVENHTEVTPPTAYQMSRLKGAIYVEHHMLFGNADTEWSTRNATLGRYVIQSNARARLVKEFERVKVEVPDPFIIRITEDHLIEMMRKFGGDLIAYNWEHHLTIPNSHNFAGVSWGKDMAKNAVYWLMGWAFQYHRKQFPLPEGRSEEVELPMETALEIMGKTLPQNWSVHPLNPERSVPPPIMAPRNTSTSTASVVAVEPPAMPQPSLLDLTVSTSSSPGQILPGGPGNIPVTETNRVSSQTAHTSSTSVANPNNAPMESAPTSSTMAYAPTSITYAATVRNTPTVASQASTSSAAASSSSTSVTTHPTNEQSIIIYGQETEQEKYVMDMNPDYGISLQDVQRLEDSYLIATQQGRGRLWKLANHITPKAKDHLHMMFTTHPDFLDPTWMEKDFFEELLPKLKRLISNTAGRSSRQPNDSRHQASIPLSTRMSDIPLKFDVFDIFRDVGKYVEQLKQTRAAELTPPSAAVEEQALKIGFFSRIKNHADENIKKFGLKVLAHEPKTIEALISALYKAAGVVQQTVRDAEELSLIAAPQRPGPQSAREGKPARVTIMEEPAGWLGTTSDETEYENLNLTKEEPPHANRGHEHPPYRNQNQKDQGRGRGRDYAPHRSHYGPQQRGGYQPQQRGGYHPPQRGGYQPQPRAAAPPQPRAANNPVAAAHTGCQACNRSVHPHIPWDTPHTAATCPYRNKHPNVNTEGVPWANSAVGQAFKAWNFNALPLHKQLGPNGTLIDHRVEGLETQLPQRDHRQRKRNRDHCKEHDTILYTTRCIPCTNPTKGLPSRSPAAYVEILSNNVRDTHLEDSPALVEHIKITKQLLYNTSDNTVDTTDLIHGYVVENIRTAAQAASLPVTVFLDTGAFHGNYASKRVAEWLIKKGIAQIAPCNKLICGANNSWCMKSLGMISIHLKFKTEVSHEALLIHFEASILDAAFDIIIGRPLIKQANLVLWFPSHFLTLDVKKRAMLANWVCKCTGNTCLPKEQNSTDHATPAHGTPRDVATARSPIERNLALIVKKKEELLTPTNSGEMWVREPRDINTVLPTTVGVVSPVNNDEIDKLKLEGSPEFKTRLRLLCERYRSLFSSTLLPTPAQVQPMELKVDLQKWRAPRNRRGPRVQTNEKDEALRSIIQKLLANNLITTSKAEFWSQVLLVPKPEPGEHRLCIDYRALNECSEGESWPLPVIKQVLERLGKHKPAFYGKMDFTSGFWQAVLTPESRVYTAFTTYMGLYEWTRVPMGLKGSPSYFQSRMAFEVLADLLYRTCELYIDDVIVHGQNEDDFLKNLEQVFARLQSKNITLNPKKCSFGMKQTEFIGHQIDKEGRSMAEAKINKVLSSSKPTTIKELRSFLGLVNYFRDHIDHHSDRVKPLFDLLKAITGNDNLKSNKGRCSTKPLSWTSASNEAYKDIIAAIAACPKLFYMEDDDSEHPIFLKTDASDYGYGAYLYQMLHKVREQPVAFSSKTFSKDQVRWSTFEKEAYGIYHAVLHFEYLLRDKKFTILTDHRNLTYVNESSSPKVIRWKLELMEFNFDIQHVPGPLNEVADYFSRIRPESEEVEILNLYLSHDPHPRQTGIIRQCHSEIWASRSDLDWLSLSGAQEYLCKLSNLHNELGNTLKMVTRIPNGTVLSPEMRDSRNDEVVGDPTTTQPHKKQKLYSPTRSENPMKTHTMEGDDTQSIASELQQLPHPPEAQAPVIPPQPAANVAGEIDMQTREYYKVFNTVHSGLPGHHGVERTLNKVLSYLQARNQRPWPGIRAHIKRFVAQCPCCQKMNQLKPVIQARPFTTATYHPWERLNIDTVGPLPESSEGHQHIIVIIDCFTRFVELYPAKTVNADDAKKAIISCIGRYGIPNTILTDGGSQFKNHTIPEVIQRMGIEHGITVAYSKEENAMIERANKEVLRHLNAMIFETKVRDEWMDYLPFVQRIMNATPHSVTKVAPAQLLFGNALQLDRGIFLPNDKLEDKESSEPTITQWIDKMLSKQNELIRLASHLQMEHDEQNKEKRSSKEYTEFEPNSFVLVAYPITRMGQRAPNKTMTPYKGPMRVIKSDGSKYIVQNLVTMEHETVHVSLMKKFHYDPRFTDPFEVAMRDSQEFLVEEILAHRGTFNDKRNLTFKVRWTGYGPEDDTWEPWKNLRLNEKLHNYLRSKKLEQHIPKNIVA